MILKILMTRMNKINLLDPEFLAQIIHFIAGLSIVWLTVLLWYFQHISPYIPLVGFLTIIINKETWFDYYTEGNAFFWNGALDYSIYCLGIIASVPITLLIIGVI